MKEKKSHKNFDDLDCKIIKRSWLILNEFEILESSENEEMQYEDCTFVNKKYMSLQDKLRDDLIEKALTKR